MLAPCLKLSMSPRLAVSKVLIKRLENLNNGVSGRLYGLCDDKSILVLGLSLSAVEKDTNVKDLAAFNGDILPHLPGGINHCGFFQITSEATNDVDETLRPDSGYSVVMQLNYISKKLSVLLYNNGENEEKDFTMKDQNEVLNLVANFRLVTTIPLRCDFEETQVESILDELEKKILTGNVGFQFQNKEVYICGDKEEDIIGMSPKSNINDLLSTTCEGNENSVVTVQMYLNQTTHDETPQRAPYIKYIKKEFKHAKIQFSLDALLTVPKSMSITQLYNSLIDGTHRNFTLARNNLLRQLDTGKIFSISLPEIYHFLPPNVGHFLSIVYSPKQSVDELKGYRESFHKALGLPLDRPLFRSANAYDFANGNKLIGNLLLNPHEKLAKTGVPDGEAYVVQGTYAYHHYMQDGFNDNGWGCAYRSLQTIFSWFRFQGYTNMAVPSHKEIQQCLVNIGDKPASFVGSKQWIGSTEVSFVLDTMLGVTSRIVNVSSGEEMTMKGGELSHHFRTQGTPIMIGGGVLAHTILGVDYNKSTGDIKFLILDPHYTGEEDLGIVTKKGWCGWKGPDFWKKDAFYNMCMPLKPKCV